MSMKLTKKLANFFLSVLKKSTVLTGFKKFTVLADMMKQTGFIHLIILTLFAGYFTFYISNQNATALLP